MAGKPSGIKSFAEFEAMARKDGRMDFGSGGPGSIGFVKDQVGVLSATVKSAGIKL